jgi:Asp-tRNA(Asn)/Glu-tRNA(Gln) amidotransferase A subunit family amidase
MADATAPYTLTATEALRQIDEGTLSPVDWVASCAQRIADREPEIRAWAHINEDAVAEANRLWEANRTRAIPIGAKDIIDVVGQPTGFGTAYARPEPALREGGSVSLLREAGCVFIGKTVTTELGHRHPGPTRNPWNTDHTPGGSSSGSAAAVADMMVPAALGTQTSGSVIRPAAYCGVIGYKPTYNDFDKTGILANAPSMDTLGLMARSIADIRLLRSILVQGQLRPATPASLSEIRVCLLTAPPWDTADEETRALLEQLTSDLAARGAVVQHVNLDTDVARLLELHRAMSGFEFKRSIAFERIHHFDELSQILREGRLADGNEVDVGQYQAMIQEVADIRLRLRDTFNEVDALIAPAAAGPAPATLQATGTAEFNSAWSLAGNPAITLPLFQSSATGLPIGCQLIGAFGEDDSLLAICEAVLSVRERS